jgi:hypothetical protein
VEFYVNGENIILTVQSACGGNNCSTPTWQTALERGKWHDFIFEVNWSEDPSVGYFQVWYDGQVVVPKQSGATLLPGGQGVYLKQGLYRDASVTETQEIYHTGMTLGTTLADVQSTAADAGNGAVTTTAEASSTGSTATAEASGAGAPDASTGGASTSSVAMQVSDALGSGSGSSDSSSKGPQTGCAQAGTTGAAVLVLMSIGALMLRRSRRGWRLP